MLRFEFVQPSEFDDPYYSIIDIDEYENGIIAFIDSEWRAEKLKQLNKDL